MKIQNSLKPDFIFFMLYSIFFISSCGITKRISKSAKGTVINDSSLLAAHIGISIYEPASGKYWYNYNGEKYFVPASNAKIPTCYAAMKYLGDSLVGAKVVPFKEDLIVYPSGDPTFLNEEFKTQPVFNFLKANGKNVILRFNAWESQKLGNGWSWNDYTEPYMAERSPFPLYNNRAVFYNIDNSGMNVLGNNDKLKVNCMPKRFSESNYWFSGKIRWYETDKINAEAKKRLLRKQDVSIGFMVGRDFSENNFYLKLTSDISNAQKIPFVTSPPTINVLLSDTLKKEVINENIYFTGDERIDKTTTKIIHSQPTDSLLKPMMRRSDNFFAEQSLLMVSNEMLGVMNDEKIIDTLLKTDFNDLPQKPRWVDGSGLSRYNLFTPQDFVAILGKMKNEFGMERIKEIFPTGGEGTISNYYKTETGFIYAKTGTLSGVVALSGFLTTKKGKELLFSVMINNHNSSATAVRRAVEKFIQRIRSNY